MLFKKADWHASSAVQNGMDFDGCTELLKFFDSLCRRPWLFQPEKPLPAVCLIFGGDNKGNPLDGIKDRLEKGRRIRCALADRDATQTSDDSISQIAEMIDGVVTELATTKFKFARSIAFPHYALASWLLFLRSHAERHHHRENTAVQADRVENQLARELREFFASRYRLAGETATEFRNVADDFPRWIRFAARYLPFFAITLMRLTWRAPRWLANHQLGVSHGRKRFLGLARRFLNWDPAVIANEAVAALLVDAFLEDLRHAYRRTGILGFGRRRTVYPVLILTSARQGSLGLLFLKLINQVRCGKRGKRHPSRSPAYSDPLLIITNGDSGTVQDLGGRLRLEPQWPYLAGDAESAYDHWREELASSRRDERTWLLPLRIPYTEKPKQDDERDARAFRTAVKHSGLPSARAIQCPYVARREYAAHLRRFEPRGVDQRLVRGSVGLAGQPARVSITHVDHRFPSSHSGAGRLLLRGTAMVPPRRPIVTQP